MNLVDEIKRMIQVELKDLKFLKDNLYYDSQEELAFIDGEEMAYESILDFIEERNN